MTNQEVLIAGAGPVGLSAAIALASAGISLARRRGLIDDVAAARLSA